jgi:60 kDa SS-A/Ro ribonucleoprotein
MNPNLFSSKDAARRSAPASNTTNDAGGRAYARTDEAALALYALTGTFNGTFYASAETHLDRVTELCSKVDPKFLAQLAVYARTNGHMKDVPAYLVAMLAKRDVTLCSAAFGRVIDNGKMLRNFAQIIRSGTVGRKSFGSRPKALISSWLVDRPAAAVFRQSTGDKPSLADIVKMVHPKPKNDEQRAFFGWLLGKKEVAFDKLPDVVRAFEAYKTFPGGELPDIPFEMLTNLATTKEAWTAIARRASWTQLRMNLNTFERHGVFEDERVVGELAAKLSNPDEVRRAKVFPYQLFSAFKFASASMPAQLKIALQQAMEVACENVPVLAGKIIVMPDASSSMQDPVTGHRGSATTAMRCIDVAALVTAAIMRKNPLARAVPFGDRVLPEDSIDFNPMDSIVTNAQKLAAISLGGTDCSLPLKAINWHKLDVDLAIFVSDNESWIETSHHRGTAVMQEWLALKQRCPKAKLACIDLTPNKTAQVTGDDILCVGGFSDNVFGILSSFYNGENDGTALVKAIKEVPI